MREGVKSDSGREMQGERKSALSFLSFEVGGSLIDMKVKQFEIWAGKGGRMTGRKIDEKRGK